MSRSMSWFAAAACVLGLGCAGQAVTDEVSSEITNVDLERWQSEVMYLDFAVSSMPMTAEELGDASRATPVQLRKHDSYLVAWAAPNGNARVGQSEAVVFAWLLEERTVEQTANDVRSEDQGETTTPDGELTWTAPDFLGGTQVDRPFNENAGPSFSVRWLDDYTNDWHTYWAFHPGCL